MGNQEPQKAKQQDFFLLDHLTKMSLSNKKKIAYYLIHPNKQAAIQNMVKQLRNYFKMDYFVQIKTLKQEMNFVNKNQLVKVIASAALSTQDIDYLQNQKNIYQIILLGSTPTTLFQTKKIIRIVQHLGDLLNVLNQLQKKDELNMPSNNILLVDEDTKLVNKYRLNYHCNTKFMDRHKAKQDFAILAQYLFPRQQSIINEFIKQYDLDLQGRSRNKMVLQWIFKNSFYWQLVTEITRNTTDPKKLSYVRLALKDLFQTIQDQYKSANKYPELYIVIEVTEEELAKLEKSKGKHLIFTSFVKGYTTQRQANIVLKQKPNAFKFIVRQNRKKMDAQVDFGYITTKDASPNVIFNIYNIFTVQQIEMNAKEGEILYGALPMNIARRKDKDRYLTKIQLDLIRNYDYLEDIMLKIDSQATLLQLSGYYKESLEIYDKKVDFIRKTNQSEQSINRCIIHKADALRISGQFQNAQKQYQSAQFKSEKMKLISLIHLAQLYMQKQDNQKFEKIIDQIAPQIHSLMIHQKQEYFKARNLIIIRTIKKGSFKKADQMLQELRLEVTTSYPLNLEGKPLVHDIYKSIATCKSKLGRHSQALEILKSTLSWQLACEGKTANVALTETLIQSVSRTSGNTKQLQLSLARLDAMSNEFESFQNRNKSSIGADLNKSLASISIS